MGKSSYREAARALRRDLLTAQADLRDRLAERGRRALWLTLGAGVLLLGGWLVAMRALRPA